MKAKISPLASTGKHIIHDNGWSGVRNKAQRTQVSVVAVFLVLVVLVAVFYTGRMTMGVPAQVQQTMRDMELAILRQQAALDKVSNEHEMNVNALAVRLAALQAASTRLDALGERLVRLGNLDPGEFDFNQPAPVGGPENLINNAHSGATDVARSIRALSKTLELQLAKLDALQLLLLDRNLESQRTPAGWPVASGWISSGFGERNDPFTGKKTLHEGVDFAGTRGSDVLGVASGVVIWAGSKKGFGKTLEIEHGNGYITRYAHNEELLVTAGERVTAGQPVAKMGSSGRASSPHVHFEVLYQGEAVNPYQFVKRGR